MDKFVGKRLDGRYELQEIIGVGGMAVVYKAYDCIEDRIVAVKILKEEFISNEEFIIRFKNESKAIAVLNHPNIVKVYDVSFGDLIQYIVMEYVDGITLKQYISKQGSLRWKDAVYLTIQVLRALQHAHDKGIVHRDVKPQNIMLLSDGTIKVTDFGIARFARSEQKTLTDKAIGSVHYISPEQARGDFTDAKADIYSSTLDMTIKKGDCTGMSAVVTANTKEGVVIEAECVGYVYGPKDVDRNEWTIEGEPSTTVVITEPKTVELTCATIVNRLPDVINAKPGFIPTCDMDELMYRPKSLDTYLK